MRDSTVGRILIDQALPEDMRGKERVLNKGGLRALLQEVAEKHPEEYREVSYKLSRIGMRVAYTTRS